MRMAARRTMLGQELQHGDYGSHRRHNSVSLQVRFFYTFNCSELMVEVSLRGEKNMSVDRLPVHSLARHT